MTQQASQGGSPAELGDPAAEARLRARSSQLELRAAALLAARDDLAAQLRAAQQVRAATALDLGSGRVPVRRRLRDG